MQSRVLAVLIAVVLALVATAALVVYVNGADRRAVAGQEPVQVLVKRRQAHRRHRPDAARSPVGGGAAALRLALQE